MVKTIVVDLITTFDLLFSSTQSRMRNSELFVKNSVEAATFRLGAMMKKCYSVIEKISEKLPFQTDNHSVN